MRVLISAVANEHFGARIAAVDPSIERVVMGADGTIRDVDGAPVDPDLPIDVAWGSADIFIDGGPARPFMGFVRSASSLRWFQSPAAGLDHPMFGEIVARGTRLTTTHVQSVAIAEFVLRSVLDHFHDAPAWWAGHERRSWDRRPFREVYGTTWLIIGLGAIGTDVARRASAFGVRLIGMRRHPTGTEPVDEVVPPGDLDAVGRADVIVVAAPATAETRRIGRRAVPGRDQAGRVAGERGEGCSRRRGGAGGGTRPRPARRGGARRHRARAAAARRSAVGASPRPRHAAHLGPR